MFFKFLFIYIFTYICKCACTKSPGQGVADGCESPTVGAGNQTKLFRTNTALSPVLDELPIIHLYLAHTLISIHYPFMPRLLMIQFCLLWSAITHNQRSLLTPPHPRKVLGPSLHSCSVLERAITTLLKAFVGPPLPSQTSNAIHIARTFSNFLDKACSRIQDSGSFAPFLTSRPCWANALSSMNTPAPP